MAPPEAWQHSRMVHGARAPSFHCESVPVACKRSFVCLKSRRRWGRPSLGSYYNGSDVTGVSCTMNKHSKGSSISATNFTAARGRNGPELENRFSACSETNILVVNVAQRAQNHTLVARPGQNCRICVPMVYAAVIAALVTVVSSWVLWQIYQVYLQSLQLSPIPGPPAAPGWLNAVLGNLSDLSDNQYHRTTTRWSEKYGAVCRLRFLNKHVSCIYTLHACPCLQKLWCEVSDIHHCTCLPPAGNSHCRPSNSLRDVKGQVYGQEHKSICDNECSKSQMVMQTVLLKIDTTTRDLGSMQLFDDKGHSGLLTSQMTPRWRAVRKAVASALSPQTLRCDAETKN